MADWIKWLLGVFLGAIIGLVGLAWANHEQRIHENTLRLEERGPRIAVIEYRLNVIDERISRIFSRVNWLVCREAAQKECGPPP